MADNFSLFRSNKESYALSMRCLVYLVSFSDCSGYLKADRIATYAVFTTPMQKAAGVGNSTPPTLKRKAQSSAEQGNSKRQMVKAEPISEPPTPTPAKEPTPPPKTPTPEPESSRRISRPSARAIEAAESDLAVEASPTVYRRALASAGGFQAVKEGSITA